MEPRLESLCGVIDAIPISQVTSYFARLSILRTSKKLGGFNLVSTQVSGQIIHKQDSLAWDSPPKPTIFVFFIFAKAHQWSLKQTTIF